MPEAVVDLLEVVEVEEVDGHARVLGYELTGVNGKIGAHFTWDYTYKNIGVGKLALYGREYVPEAPRRYQRKVKNAQEAHEAIRPAGEAFRTPDEAGRELSGDTLRLYDLIWKRTVASQMADARGQSMQVRLGARSSSGEDAEFATSGKTIEFPGFLMLVL